MSADFGLPGVLLAYLKLRFCVDTHRIELKHLRGTYIRLNASFLMCFLPKQSRRRDGRVAEGARLESVFTRKGNVGSNPTLSAMFSTTYRP